MAERELAAFGLKLAKAAIDDASGRRHIPIKEAARALRFWLRELNVDLDAKPAPKAD